MFDENIRTKKQLLNIDLLELEAFKEWNPSEGIGSPPRNFGQKRQGRREQGVALLRRTIRSLGGPNENFDSDDGLNENEFNRRYHNW